MNRNHKISIVIIAYNEQKYLPKLLDSLARQSLKNFEIIVVDSKSKDKTWKICYTSGKRFDEYTCIKLDRAAGPAYARNMGAKAAKYERLLFLDADTILKEDFIFRLTIDLKNINPDAATCLIRINNSSILSNFGAYFLNFFTYTLQPFYSAAYGACLISTKELHTKLNGFDESLSVCEDCNYIKRARKVGSSFKILSPFFYTSDRRAKDEGGIKLLKKYIRFHLYRMFTGNELLKDKVDYQFGNYQLDKDEEYEIYKVQLKDEKTLQLTPRNI